MSFSLVENECPKSMILKISLTKISTVLVTVSTLLLAPLLSFPTLFYIILRDRSLFIPWGGDGGGSCKVHLVLWGGTCFFRVLRGGV